MAEQDRLDDQGVYAIFDEIAKKLLPLDPYSRLRVYRTLGTLFGLEDSYPKIAANADSQVPANLAREPRFTRSEKLTPKEFLLQKKPNTNVERIACLAYYLARYRDILQFKPIDINKLNTEAAQTKLSSASYAVRDAVNAGYLAAATKGMKQLSARGEQYVEALPDRNAAKATGPRGKSRRPRRKTGTGQAGNDSGREETK